MPTIDRQRISAAKMFFFDFWKISNYSKTYSGNQFFNTSKESKLTKKSQDKISRRTSQGLFLDFQHTYSWYSFLD